ncbi:hypothetical protein GCM10010231_65770 [Streptomyces sindenensis]|nr:hypothetical protein GCM10010231_65770 [Streptomyces sindenensis]
MVGDRGEREAAPAGVEGRVRQGAQGARGTGLRPSVSARVGDLDAKETGGGVADEGQSKATTGQAAVEYGVRRKLRATGITGALRKAARHLTRGEAGLAAWFRRWARLERDAVSLCTYECRLVPGLLQSEAYARAVFEGTIPLRTDEELAALLTARMDRQRIMRERPTVAFSFILEEHVFRRRFGDAEAMRELFDHVLERTAPRSMTLQVVPLEAGLHPCLDGPVRILETSSGQRLGYSEGQENGRLISDRKEVSLLCQRMQHWGSQALSPNESRALLERSEESYERQCDGTHLVQVQLQRQPGR